MKNKLLLLGDPLHPCRRNRFGLRVGLLFLENYSVLLIPPSASHSPTPGHNCPPQMHEGHPNPSSVPPERRVETHSHP